MNQSPYQTPKTMFASADMPQPLVGRVVWAVAWAIVVGTFGGYACGLAISRFGELGSASLWALGALAGYVGRRILAAPSHWVGCVLAAANVCALVVAEVCWIHWNTIQGAASWQQALALLPTFVRDYELAALIGAVFCGFGAWSAYQRVLRTQPLNPGHPS
jgi:hypothetical protein